MNLRYQVDLSQAERDELKALLSGGHHTARKMKRAQILLAADAGASDDEIAISIGVGGSTVYRTKRRFVLGNPAGDTSQLIETIEQPSHHLGHGLDGAGAKATSRAKP